MWRRDVVKDRDATRRERWLRCNFADCLSNYTNCTLPLAEESRVIRLVSAQSQCSLCPEKKKKGYAKNANVSTLRRETTKNYK